MVGLQTVPVRDDLQIALRNSLNFRAGACETGLMCLSFAFTSAFLGPSGGEGSQFAVD